MVLNVKIDAKGHTDIGRIRTTNQDAFLVDIADKLFVVADGMGGHAGGEIASQVCAKEISGFIKKNQEIFDDSPNRVHPDQKVGILLSNAVNFASTKIYERALEEPSLKGMGTTATVLKIVDHYAYCAHVGDSRLYLIRCGFVYQLTNDHSLVEEQLRAGLLTRAEAQIHHLRNVITRSVGYQEEEEVDTIILPLEDQDVFILCTDGLHGKISEKELGELTISHKTHAVEKLVAKANEAGGEDNITLIILAVTMQHS